VKFRLIDTGKLDGPMNMAVDEALLLALTKGETPPVLRFYQWDPPAVSLGYFQKVKGKINTAECRKKGIDIVRRITGGRAVLHKKELTYSIVIPEKADFIPEGISESYAVLCRGIISGLKKLGLKAQLTEKSQRKNLSAACFDAPSWNELKVNEKKIAGSAQTRKKGVLLQHGSIPLELDMELFFSLLDFPDEDSKTKSLKLFKKNATAVNQELSTNTTYSELKKALLEGWKETLNIEGSWRQLNPQELETAEKLKANYLKWD